MVYEILDPEFNEFVDLAIIFGVMPILASSLARIVVRTPASDRGSDVQSEVAMNEPDYCSRFSHPAWGVVDIAEIPGPLPLVESQEPLWFAALDEEVQERLQDRWWQDLMAWLSREGAAVVMVELMTWDVETAIAGGYTRIGKWSFRADWGPSTAEALYRMNPQWGVVRSATRQLLSMFETWDGVTTEQGLRGPYVVD